MNFPLNLSGLKTRSEQTFSSMPAPLQYLPHRTFIAGCKLGDILYVLEPPITFTIRLLDGNANRSRTSIAKEPKSIHHSIVPSTLVGAGVSPRLVFDDFERSSIQP